MPVVINRLTVTSIVLFGAIALLAGADKDLRFVPGRASSYPTKQTNQGVTIAAVPFTSEDQVKAAFGKLDPNKYGVLPVLVVIQNDGKQALRLDNLKAEYILSDRTKIEATPPKDVPYLSAVRQPSIQNSPLPTGSPRVSRKKNPLGDGQIDVRAFSARMLPPGEQASGFFYFQTPLRRDATVYVAGMNEAGTGKELFYFEIPLSESGSN
jgi:hypothetical protein